MLRALHDARARTVDPCVYALEGDFARWDSSATRVTVTTAGRGTHDVLRDAANGWEYDTPSAPRSLTLRGSACDEVTNDAGAKVTMSFGCM
jgi:hypothetical protein